MSAIDRLIGNPFLLNLLAQQGYAETPGPGPLGVIGRAGLATAAQGREDVNDRFRNLYMAAQAQNLLTPKAKEQWTTMTDDQEAQIFGNPIEGRAFQINNLTKEIRPVIGVPGDGVTVNTGDSLPTNVFGLKGPQFDDLVAQEESAVSANVKLRAATTLKSALEGVGEDDGAFTGAFANVRQAAGRFLDAIADDSQDTNEALADLREKLANSELADASAGILVGQIIRLFGSGTGLSDADREFARQIAGGLRTNTKAGLLKIADQNIADATREIGRYNSILEGISSGENPISLGGRFSPINLPTDDRDISEYSRAELEAIAKGQRP
jgi:hypothetical protein